MSKNQGKSGSPAKRVRAKTPLVSTALGRRVAELETMRVALEGQRMMAIRALGALVVELAKARGDTHAEPVVVVPFDDMNVGREIGFAIEKDADGKPVGLAIGVTASSRPKGDIARDVTAVVEQAEREAIGAAEQAAYDKHAAEMRREDRSWDRNASTRRG